MTAADSEKERVVDEIGLVWPPGVWRLVVVKPDTLFQRQADRLQDSAQDLLTLKSVLRI